MSGHLTAIEVSEWLAGTRAASAEQHVAECAGCTAELERVRQPLTQFSAVMRAWCAAEAPAPRPEAIPAAIHRQRRLAVLRVALATTAALLVAAPVYRQHLRSIEIALQDDALLEKVQAEIARPVPEPLQPLEKLVAWNAPAGQTGSGQ